MARSIRTLLLSWYVVILTATLIAFGGVLFASRRRALLGGVDDRILGHARAIAAAAEDDRDDEEGGNDDGAEHGADEQGLEIELAEDYLAPFREGLPASPYFVLWNREGEVALASRAGLGVSRSSVARPAVVLPSTDGFRDRGSWREVAVSGRDGIRVVVGESLVGPRRELRRFLVLLVVLGAAVLGLSLAGGWFLSGRVLAPIHRISRAASEISGSNLSRRIDPGRTASELGRLAATLNDAFDRLQGAVERQSRFTADASHELRTPVAVVLAAAEQVLERDRGQSEYREALEAILRAARRMKALVDGLMTLARADAGTLVLERDPVDLAALAAETLAMLRPLAAARGVELSSSGSAGQVAGDRERLGEVLVNLVTNAVAYNREGGSVTVTLREEAGRRSGANGGASDEVAERLAGGEVVIEVRDTGIGIPPDHLPRIFDRFHRVDPARAREQGGCGLGLAIARRIVEAHGGTIHAASRPGEGSVFTVRLPGVNLFIADDTGLGKTLEVSGSTPGHGPLVPGLPQVARRCERRGPDARVARCTAARKPADP